MNKIKAPKLIDLIVTAVEEKKAIDPKVLDVRKTSTVVDYMIICSADSDPQLRAIEKEIDKQLRNNKIKGFRWEGVAQSGWIVLDLGEVVVHVMGRAERDYYNLEELWGKEGVIYHY
ncbi:MAG: ribosome silencing factor [Candidatus Margulisbacteria bacterium]|nr:ribosome silencing factor [Candidatus Margulisiibacteriota bacterium]